MHLLEILSRRPVPAAGVFLCLTRRCPLSCAHCSTSSTMASEQHDGDAFLRFVRTFTPADRPDIVVLTGGEALLRPRLAQDITTAAHEVGARVSLISGMFFTRTPTVPPAIERAIDGVDHFAASLDVFHEAEVPRAAVFQALARLLDKGHDVSLQVVGLGPHDRYLEDVTADARATFGDRVPMLVTQVGASGRAAEWLPAPLLTAPARAEPEPCPMAAWPVVTFDGAVAACCNQQVVDGPTPDHLRLGHIDTDSWAAVRARCLGDPMVRALRIFGPQYVTQQVGASSRSCHGYCATCHRLAGDTETGQRVELLMARPTMAAVEVEVASMLRQVPLRGIVPRYAGLVSLGYDRQASACAAG